jgi:zinc/manganese transport system substrate-binding protein
MITRYAFTVALALLVWGGIPALAVNVVTSTPDFADITRQIGGTRVQVDSLARGDQDLHRVEPRPSFVTKLAKADLVVRIGMDLDLWMDALLQAARNANVREGGKGYVDASMGITPLEVPQGKVDGAKGDIHVFGNPHYWLDPANGKVIARNILAGLKRVDAKGADIYQKNYEAFVKRLDAKMADWQKQMAPLKGTKVVTYHTTWSYFNKRFGLILIGTVETKPGIPPSAAYTTTLMADMKKHGVKAVMTTSYYPSRFTDLIHRETGATVLVLPSSVGGSKEATDYFALFDTTIAQMLAVK